MARYAPHPSVVCTVLDDGGVLLHLDTKYYYSLNGTGVLVWSLIEGGEADLAAALRPRYPGVDLAGGVEVFVAELARESLLVEGGEPNGWGSPVRPATDEWTPPQLRRHEVPLNQILSNPFDPSVPLAE